MHKVNILHLFETNFDALAITDSENVNFYTLLQ